MFETADDVKDADAVGTQMDEVRKEPEDEQTLGESVVELMEDDAAKAMDAAQQLKAESEELAVEEQNTTEEPVEEEPVEEELAEESAEEVQEEAETFVKVPRPSLDEILSKAETVGDTPEVMPYDVFGVTVVDFSKCI